MRRYSCDICDKRVPRVEDLYPVLNCNHLPNVREICGECNAIFEELQSRMSPTFSSEAIANTAISNILMGVNNANAQSTAS